MHEGERVLDNIQNGQQGARQTQELAEAVETKVNQIASQIHHLGERDGVKCHEGGVGGDKETSARQTRPVNFYLQREFILVFISEGVRLADHVSQVLLNKLHGVSELPLHLLPGAVAGLVLEPAAEHRHHHTHGQSLEMHTVVSAARVRCQQSPANLVHTSWICPSLHDYQSEIFNNLSMMVGERIDLLSLPSPYSK